MGEINTRRKYVKSIKMNKALFVLFFTFLFFVPIHPINAEEQAKDKEPFYLQLSRAIIRLEHYVDLKFEGSNQIKEKNYPDGTAFFVKGGTKLGRKLFVVTARHVTEKHYNLHARVQCMNKKTGKMEVVLLKLPRDRWIYHPAKVDKDTHYVDVAAMRITMLRDYGLVVFGYWPESEESEENQLPYKDPDPPQAILTFGFPGDIGFELSEQRPFGRLGIVAMRTGKKFLKFKGKFVDERAYIADVEAFPGNSGSPVINQISPFDRQIKLLGLLIASNIPMDFAIIEPVSRIRETLEEAKKQSVEDLKFWYRFSEEDPEKLK